MLSTLDVSASGLFAQRVRLDTIAQNVANVNVTRDAAGRPNPYRRRFAVFQSGDGTNGDQRGVSIKKIQIQQGELPTRHIEGHPDADANGYVKFPNVDLAIEFVNALEATRAYEANITVMDTTKSMMNSALRLIA